MKPVKSDMFTTRPFFMSDEGDYHNGLYTGLMFEPKDPSFTRYGFTFHIKSGDLEVLSTKTDYTENLPSVLNESKICDSEK